MCACKSVVGLFSTSAVGVEGLRMWEEMYEDITARRKGYGSGITVSHNVCPRCFGRGRVSAEGYEGVAAAASGSSSELKTSTRSLQGSLPSASVTPGASATASVAGDVTRTQARVPPSALPATVDMRQEGQHEKSCPNTRDIETSCRWGDVHHLNAHRSSGVGDVLAVSLISALKAATAKSGVRLSAPSGCNAALFLAHNVLHRNAQRSLRTFHLQPPAFDHLCAKYAP